MAHYEDWELELMCELVVIDNGGEVCGEDGLRNQGYVRLICAMMLSCRGAEDCNTCTLGGYNICAFETEDEPPAPCLAGAAV